MNVSWQGWRRGIAVGVLAVAGIAGGACEPAPGMGVPGTGAIPVDLARFERAGPFPTTTFQQNAFTFFVPTGADATFPVMTWGNGTFNTPQTYNALLTHIASHGIIVVASNSSNVGTGQQQIQGLNLVAQLNGQQGGQLFQRVGSLICAAGYSQGGGGTVNASSDPRVMCSVPIAPDVTLTSQANATGRSRILLLGGGADGIAPVGTNAQRLFNQASAPKIISVLGGAGHLEVLGNGGRFRGYITAFLVSQLRNDAQATGLFAGASCGLCGDPRYTTERLGF
jgi:hypothetical protein